MPRPKPVADINYLTKTEKMTNLPISYYLKNKTERMVDLPALYYGNNVPALETNGLIYFLDGVGYNKINNNWIDSNNKARNSKATPSVLESNLISPISLEKSFQFIQGTTSLLQADDLSSDLFNDTQRVFTLSVYFKINTFISNTRILNISRTNVGTSWALYSGPVNTIRFRRSDATNEFTINLNQKYLATISYKDGQFYYYLNNQLVRSEIASLTPAIPPSAPVYIGGSAISSSVVSSSNIYSFSAYNRVLSIQEVSNNYQYLKQRYE